MVITISAKGEVMAQLKVIQLLVGSNFKVPCQQSQRDLATAQLVKDLDNPRQHAPVLSFQ